MSRPKTSHHWSGPRSGRARERPSRVPDEHPARYPRPAARGMTRAEYLGGGRFAVTADAPTAPGPGEVRLSVAYTGICGTDLHIVHGHMDRRVAVPGVIGHEMSGR